MTAIKLKIHNELPLIGHHPDQHLLVGRDATPVLSPVAAHHLLITHLAPPQVPLHGEAWLMKCGLEAPPLPLDPSSFLDARSWMFLLKPGGHLGATLASLWAKETLVWRPTRILLERRDKKKLTLQSSSFMCLPTTTGTNPNLETHRCLGQWFWFLCPSLLCIEWLRGELILNASGENKLKLGLWLLTLLFF